MREIHHGKRWLPLTSPSATPSDRHRLIHPGTISPRPTRNTDKIGGAKLQFYYSRGGRKRLPKFKFSAKFPIGLHVILQIQIKKFENDYYLMWKIILTKNPSRFNVEPLLK